MDMMDIIKLAGNTDLTKQVSRMTGIPESTAGAVMENVLPMLLNGMKSQASNKETAAGFAKAVEEHGKADASDLQSFLGNVDLTDGSKIVKHLLGGAEEEVAAKATKKSGIDTKTVMKIMAILAPLLMSKMGNTAKKTAAQTSGSDMMSIIGGLMDGVDASDVIKLLGKLI